MSFAKPFVTLVALIALVGCQPKRSDDSPDPTAFMSPKNSLSLGRQSAVIQHFSKTWQVTHIDNTPTQRQVLLDFSTIGEGRAKALVNQCSTLWLEFDQDQLATGNLQVTHIKRDLGQHCSDHFDDLMMAILGDVQWLQKDDTDTLVLSSYQHTLTLQPQI